MDERVSDLTLASLARGEAPMGAVAQPLIGRIARELLGERERASQLTDALKTRHDALSREAEASGSRSKARQLRERAAGIGEALFIIAASAGSGSAAQPKDGNE